MYSIMGSSVVLNNNIIVYCDDHGFRISDKWSPKGYSMSCGCTLRANAKVQLSAEDEARIRSKISEVKNGKG